MKNRRREFKRSGNFCVYIVECANGTYYTGSTKNLEDRIKLHNSGDGAKYLRGKTPVSLAYAKEYKYYKNVLHAERDLKKLTRAQKKELIKIYNKTPQFSSKTKRGV